jgi:DNA-binding response OmpR family regulator
VAKILIVDDDVDLVEDCRLVLEHAKHVVVAAHNVGDGKAAVAREKPDLVILDVMMDQPDDGIVMAQELRREGVRTPILMLTSIAKVTGLSYDRSADFVPVDAFQEKPVSPKQLLATVDQLLAKGR